MRLNGFFITLIVFLFTLIFVGTSLSQYQGPRDDPIVIRIVKLDHADAEDLAKVLRPFLSKNGIIAAYSHTNSLIIKDKKSIVEELVKVIKGRLENDE